MGPKINCGSCSDKVAVKLPHNVLDKAIKEKKHINVLELLFTLVSCSMRGKSSEMKLSGGTHWWIS